MGSVRKKLKVFGWAGEEREREEKFTPDRRREEVIDFLSTKINSMVSSLSREVSGFSVKCTLGVFISVVVLH